MQETGNYATLTRYHRDENGEIDFRNYAGRKVFTNIPIYRDMLPWQAKGLSYTATGYGKKIPTIYKVKHNSRLYRVYIRIFSNSGTLYIRTKEGDLFVDM